MYSDKPENEFTIGFSENLISIPFTYKIYYSENDHGTDTSLYATDNTPVGIDRTVQLMKGMRHHFVRLKNLTPNTNYYFVLAYTDPSGTYKQLSKRYYSKTMSDNAQDPISFVAGGDSRLNIDEGPIATLESITIRKETNKMVAKLNPDFVAFGGDYTFANTEIEWIQWFTDWELTYSSDGKITPIVAAIGNHEVLPFGCPQCDNSVVNQLFDTPNKDNYYAITFNNNLFRLYTLNTEMAIEGAQTEWLVNDLADNRNVLWKGAQYHKPIRPHEAGKSDNNDAFANWAEPFYREQVRLVIECDAHVVKTTWPVIPTTAGDDDIICGEAVDHNFVKTTNGKGTTYVGEGTWAALRTGDDAKTWTRDMGSINQIKWVWVFENEIQARTVQTYKSDDANYTNNVEQLTDSSKFTIPDGVTLWSGQQGDEMVSIKNNNHTAVPTNPCQTVGVERIEALSTGMIVAPNPAQNGTFTIRLKHSAKISKVEIYTLNGKMMQQFNFSGDQHKVKLNQYGNGILIVVDNVNGKFMEKVIMN
tara:strand:+ start:47396 stop:48991 length:1596 start_codon:yes stop_codon:yes gene_type:complete